LPAGDVMAYAVGVGHS